VMGGMSLAPFRGCGVSDCLPLGPQGGGVGLEVERCWLSAQPLLDLVCRPFGVGMLPLSRQQSSNTGEAGPFSGPNESFR
jgi:hypothetical protein